jgi:hypothetical protein
MIGLIGLRKNRKLKPSFPADYSALLFLIPELGRPDILSQYLESCFGAALKTGLYHFF